MTSHIDQPIKVGAVFTGASIHPAWFRWEGRKYNVKQVNYAWQSKKGNSLVYHFSVSDESNSYEISFDSGKMTWRLEKTE